MTVAYARLDPAEERGTWLEWRRQGIGGSDIAGLCGMSRFSTPTSIYLDKLGMLADDDGNESMRWGRLLETVIAEEFAERTGLEIIGEQIVATNTDAPWQRCTLDLLVGESPTSRLDDAIALGEIKNSSSFGFDDIPDEYAVQVQWQLGITGLPRAYLIVLHNGRRLVIYVIEHDPIAFARLTRIAERFWRGHVLAKNPPPLDGDEATTDALKDAYRDRAEDSETRIDVELALEWRRRKNLAEIADAHVKEIENRIRAELGTHTTGVDHEGRPLVTWKPQRARAPFDLDGLRAKYPDIAAEFTGDAGTTRVLRPTKQLKEKVTAP